MTDRAHVPEPVEHPFSSGGVRCAAWLFRPPGDGPAPAPGVVLGHGFGMTRACRLDAWARRFAAAGIVALAFDYRGFGDSAGAPRQVVDPAAQRADWRAALAHLRATDGVDPARVALWGTSFAGGHVLALAAQDGRPGETCGRPRIAAVVAQVPFVDGRALLRGGGRRRPSAARVRHTVRLVADAARDAVAARRGRPRRYVPVAGELGSGAVIAGPGAERALHHLVPPDAVWHNEVAAAVALRIPFERPARHADRIGCPVLVAVCERDAVTPPAAARAVAARIPDAELHTYPFAHFEAYLGAGFEALCADQVEFLVRHLRP